MAVQDNNLLTDSIIAKESLRLLKNELVFAPIVFRGYEKYFIRKVGESISVKLPYRVKTASGSTLVKQPLVDQTTTISVDNQEHVGLEYGLKDLTLSIEQFSERYLKSAMCSLANAIDKTIADTLTDTFHTTGTPGTAATAFIDFANAQAKQITYGVPQDGMNHAVLNPFQKAGLSDEVTKLLNGSLNDGAFTKGYAGMVSEYKTYMTQQLPTHTVGAHGGTPLVNGATQSGSSIVTDGWTISTQVLNKGDIITFANVFGVNPQNYTSTGLLQEFVVTADVTSDGSGNATIPVSPALNDSNQTITNGAGASVSTKAYQNVDALPADNAAITVSGTASTEYELSYLFHRDAIALVMVDIELPKTAQVKARAADPDTGLSLTLTGDYDITEFTEIHRIDAIWGTKLIYPELAMRMWGDAR